MKMEKEVAMATIIVIVACIASAKCWPVVLGICATWCMFRYVKYTVIVAGLAAIIAATINIFIFHPSVLFVITVISEIILAIFLAWITSSLMVVLAIVADRVNNGGAIINRIITVEK